MGIKWRVFTGANPGGSHKLGPGHQCSFDRTKTNLVPRVLRLLGQRFGRQERLWGNGIFSIFLIGYSGNNEIREAEVGSM